MTYNENELERAAFTVKPLVKQAARKRKLEEMQANLAPGPSAILSEPKRKKPRPPPPATSIPCCLCISSDEVGLLPVHDPPLFGYSGFDPRVVDGTPQWQAHGECAKIVPETWVDDVDGQDFVFGVDAIPKDRWQLVSSSLQAAKPPTYSPALRNVPHALLVHSNLTVPPFSAPRASAHVPSMFPASRKDWAGASSESPESQPAMSCSMLRLSRTRLVPERGPRIL